MYPRRMSSLKSELADHIYQYLCHEAQYSDLSESARESLAAASECIEHAYKLNSNNSTSQNPNGTSTTTTSTNTTSNNNNNTPKSTDGTFGSTTRSAQILPDELLRIFTRHKEFLIQQQDASKYPLKSEPESSISNEKLDIKSISHPMSTASINDSHNPTSNTGSGIANPKANTSTSNQLAPSTSSNNQSQSQQNQQTTTTKQHTQHTISQLPMTTRKKLIQLRAQIKRQASKAAKSRLEKRSSVSGVASTRTGGSISRHLGNMMGASLDAGNSSHSNNKLAGDSHNPKDIANFSSSADSPSTYSSNQSTSSPIGHCANTFNAPSDSNITSKDQSPNQQNESSTSSSGGKHSGSNQISAGQHNNNSSFGVSVHQKNFKQKLIALIKKFRTDGSDFDSEEQYREALERELMKATAGRGSRAIEELLEEDIDVEEGSGSEPDDWDNISESSTPKPSLRPFFSSTTLDKI